MASVIQYLMKQELLPNPPKHFPANVHYETVMGSISYGVSNDDSDVDVYGFSIPEKDDIFPHLRGEISGFDKPHQGFQQYQQHHIKDASSGKEYDIAIFNIVKYFQLCMECNPNMLDSLFTPDRCVRHVTAIGSQVRSNRKLFLSKGAFPKLKGYAYSQMSKIENQSNSSNPKRAQTVIDHGYDTKFGYHVVRLVSQAEQILLEGDLNLEEKGRREMMKAIRRGEWPLEELKKWFFSKVESLEKLYNESPLCQKPDTAGIKRLLIESLEAHYGNLSDSVVKQTSTQDLLRDMQALLDSYKSAA